MGAGGIVNQRATIMLPVLNDSSIYDYLSDADKDHVESLNQKGALNCIDADVQWMARKIHEVCC